MNDICEKCGDTTPLGPNKYVFIKDGKFKKSKFTFNLKEKDLQIYNDK